MKKFGSRQSGSEDRWRKYDALSPDERITAYRSECSWPTTYYHLTALLAKSLNKDRIRVLEIGVALGYHAQSLIDSLPGCEYFGVDPYLAGYDPKDFFCSEMVNLFDVDSQNHGHTQLAMDMLYETVEKRLKNLGSASLWRGTLASAVESGALQQGTFDFVWVDGSHRYEDVLLDLNLASPLMTADGILAGDDYNWPDVRKAARAFASSNKLELNVITNEARSGYQLFFFRSPQAQEGGAG